MNLLFIAAPYAAFALFVAGVIWRFRTTSTISSRSSQLLESRALAWGTIPFHLGIITLFLFHAIPLIAPDAWRAFAAKRIVIIESIGFAAAVLCLIGLCVLFVRRVTSGTVRAGSTAADLIVLLVLILQVALGIGVASAHRWGALWAVGTTVPYLRSVIALHPDPSFITGIPMMMTWHLAGAWLVLALLPFTRLVHMLTIPFAYLVRPPQKVVWMSTGR